MSGAVQYKLNLSDREVKEHLVNHFHVREQYLLTLCLGLMLKSILDNPPTVSLVWLEAFHGGI